MPNYQLFPPSGQRAEFFQNVGDCYLLATLDYFFSCEEGTKLIQSLFTASDEGVYLRLKHTELSHNLRTHMKTLQAKYSYVHDKARNEDVFFIRNDYITAIRNHDKGAFTHYLSVQILEHIIPYYYHVNEEHKMADPLISVIAHNRKDVLRNKPGQSQTEFLAQLFGIRTHETMTLDEAIRFKHLFPNFPIYLSMKSNTSRHAYLFDSVEELPASVLLLRNPHDNRDLRRYSLEDVRARNPRFVRYIIQPGQETILRRMLQINEDEAKRIIKNKELFDFLINLATKRSQLTVNEVQVILELYQRYQSRLIHYYDQLSERSQENFHIALGVSKGNINQLISMMQELGVSYRQLQRIDLVHQLLEHKILLNPKKVPLEHLNSADPMIFSQALQKLDITQHDPKKAEAILNQYEFLHNDPIVQQYIKDKLRAFFELQIKPINHLEILPLPKLQPQQVEPALSIKKNNFEAEDIQNRIRFSLPSKPELMPSSVAEPKHSHIPESKPAKILEDIAARSPSPSTTKKLNEKQMKVIEKLLQGLLQLGYTNHEVTKNAEGYTLFHEPSEACAGILAKALLMHINSFIKNPDLAQFKLNVRNTLTSDAFIKFAQPYTWFEKVYSAFVSVMNAFFHWFDFLSTSPRSDFFTQRRAKRALQLETEFDNAIHTLENMDISSTRYAENGIGV